MFLFEMASGLAVRSLTAHFRRLRARSRAFSSTLLIATVCVPGLEDATGFSVDDPEPDVAAIVGGCGSPAAGVLVLWLESRLAA